MANFATKIQARTSSRTTGPEGGTPPAPGGELPAKVAPRAPAPAGAG